MDQLYQFSPGIQDPLGLAGAKRRMKPANVYCRIGGNRLSTAGKQKESRDEFESHSLAVGCDDTGTCTC